jgi:hypothetical protein
MGMHHHLRQPFKYLNISVSIFQPRLKAVRFKLEVYLTLTISILFHLNFHRRLVRWMVVRIKVAIDVEFPICSSIIAFVVKKSRPLITS